MNERDSVAPGGNWSYFSGLRPGDDLVRGYRAAGVWRDEGPLADLRKWHRETPEATAVISSRSGTGVGRLTYRELNVYVDRFACALRSLGVEPGQVVAVQLPNWWQVGALLLACARVGAVFAPLMMTIRPRELERMLLRLDARVYVSVDRWGDVRYRDAATEMAPRLPELRHRVVVAEGETLQGTVDFRRHFEQTPWERESGLLAATPAEDPDRVAVVLFTSGTTGEPKGVLHTFNTLYAGASALVEAEGLGNHDRVYTTQSVTHIFGTLYNILIPLLAGGTSVLSDTWNPRKVLEFLAEHEATVLAGAPPFIAELVAAAQENPRRTASLRMVFSGATTVPGTLVSSVPQTWGVRLRTLWGMTEVPGHTWTRRDDPPLWGRNSDGRPGPGLALDFRSETGAQPTPEQPARLFVRGGGVCLATFGRDSGELKLVAGAGDGWYDTGDLAVPDGRGGLRIIGRTADRIGGSFMIPISDVETELLAHPKVQDVALVGYLDGGGNERACAVITHGAATPTLIELRNFLTARGMTDWYQPSRVEVVTELPRNPVGKVRRDLLRRHLQGNRLAADHADASAFYTHEHAMPQHLTHDLREPQKMISMSGPHAADKPEVSLDGHQLTVEEVYQVSRSEGGPKAGVTEEAALRMKASLKVKDDLIAAGIPIYGVTTGFGDSSNRQISAEKVVALQRNLLRFLRVGTGPTAPDDIIRATMLIRANCAARGNSAIRQEPVRLLLDMLRLDILPRIPERGSVGASGDLAPLSYLAAALTGEGVVTYQGESMPAAEALRRTGLRPVELQAKEGLALVNGTSFMSAYLALAFSEACELAWAADLCTALLAEVRRSSREQFSAFPHANKPHPGQIASAGNIWEMLEGSSLIRADVDFHGEGMTKGEGYLELERGVQDPYSVRCAPHVLGVLRDTLQWSGQWVRTEINSSNDNPLFDADSSTVHNSGNFYGGHVAQAAGALAVAVASVGDLLDRQMQLLVDPKFSLGLPANLIAPVESSHPEAGLHHGFKGAQIAVSALTAEALHLTMPVSSFSRSTEAHNQDKVSMGTIAARHSRTVVRLISEVTAVHLTALCQAAEITGADGLGTRTGKAYRYLRDVVPFVHQDRPLDQEFQDVAGLVADGSLRRAVMAEGRA